MREISGYLYLATAMLRMDWSGIAFVLTLVPIDPWNQCQAEVIRRKSSLWSSLFRTASEELPRLMAENDRESVGFGSGWDPPESCPAFWSRLVEVEPGDGRSNPSNCFSRSLFKSISPISQDLGKKNSLDISSHIDASGCGNKKRNTLVPQYRELAVL